MDESRKLDRTWLCSIVFSDIVNYSSQSVELQMKWKRYFNDVLLEALRAVPPDDRIMLDTGDGAAICFVGEPEVALLSTISMRNAFVDQARMSDAGHRTESHHHFLVDDQHGDKEDERPQEAGAVVLAGLRVGGHPTGVVVADHDDQAGAHDRQQGEQPRPPRAAGAPLVVMVIPHMGQFDADARYRSMYDFQFDETEVDWSRPQQQVHANSRAWACPSLTCCHSSAPEPMPISSISVRTPTLRQLGHQVVAHALASLLQQGGWLTAR